MGQEIVIYDAASSKKSGSIVISKSSRLSLASQSLGVFFLALSFCGVMLLIVPIFKAELRYRIHLFRGHQQSIDELTESKFGSIISPNDNEFELAIPKIGIKTIVQINVDPSREQEYKKILATKAAHAVGSDLPGEGGLVYIFGHSTNSPLNIQYFNPVFYLLNKLDFGDEIGIVYKGKVYIYGVAEKKVIEPDDFSDITIEPDKEKLILQTCWPPGTAWQRLLIIAYPIT